MMKRWLHRATRKLESRFNYDATYLHEVIDASPVAAIKFGFFQIMSQHRKGVSKDAYFAARLAAALSEDCGPCSQLVVNFALQEKVRPQVLAALLRGDLEKAGKDAELGFRYGIAVGQNTQDAPALAQQAEKRFGKQGMVTLAFAVASARVYPAIKRGMGHGAACSTIIVATETIVLGEAA